MTEEEYLDQLETLEGEINSPQSAARYLEFLLLGYRNGFFENQSVADFVDGAVNILEAWDSWQAKSRLDDPNNLTWRSVALLFEGAFEHS